MSITRINENAEPSGGSPYGPEAVLNLSDKRPVNGLEMYKYDQEG